MEYQKEVRKAVQQIVKNYKPEKIILFGSFCYGKPNRDSDLDLLIVKKQKKITTAGFPKLGLVSIR